MLLENIAKDPHASYRYAERYVHFRDYPPIAELGDVKPQYTSFSGDEIVDVAMVWVPAKLCQAFLSRLDIPPITDIFLRGDTIAFPIHPQVLHDRMCPLVDRLVNASSSITRLPTTPTASLRTFLTLGEPAFYIKTHFPGRISRHLRHLRVEKAIRSRWLTDHLSRLSDLGVLPGFGFYPELLSIVYPEGDTCGATIRDITPYPRRSEPLIRLPLFALYAKDLHAPADLPLILQLSALKNQAPDDYLIDAILRPHIEMWGRAAFDAGVLLEAHGQNTVVEFDADWNVVRFCARDLGNMTIWPKRLVDQGHELPPQVHKHELDVSIGTELSLTFDFLVGSVLYDHLVDTVAQHGYSAEAMRARVAAAFAESNPWSKDYFPETVVRWEGFAQNKRKVQSFAHPRYRLVG